MNIHDSPSPTPSMRIPLDVLQTTPTCLAGGGTPFNGVNLSRNPQDPARNQPRLENSQLGLRREPSKPSPLPLRERGGMWRTL